MTRPLFTALRFAAPVLGLAAIGIAPAPAADPDRGRMLYENHCTGCHQSVVHIREGRRVDSPASLRAQIQRWQRTQGLAWSDEDVEDVQAYLGETFYDFAP